MIEFTINGRKFVIENVVFDLNGTLGTDGVVPEDVKNLLLKLSKRVNVYILTSDTFGTASSLDIPVEVLKIDSPASLKKKRFVQEIGSNSTVAVGNGFNDHLMLKEAVLGICVVGAEGAYSVSLECSDIVVTDIKDAINLLLNPKRIVATLRD